MGLVADLTEVKKFWQGRSFIEKLVLILIGLSSTSSLASLADTLIQWKGIFAIMIQLYRDYFSIYLLELVKLVNQTAEPYHVDTMVIYSIVLGAILRSRYVEFQEYEKTSNELLSQNGDTLYFTDDLLYIDQSQIERHKFETIYVQETIRLILGTLGHVLLYLSCIFFLINVDFHDLNNHRGFLDFGISPFIMVCITHAIILIRKFLIDLLSIRPYSTKPQAIAFLYSIVAPLILLHLMYIINQVWYAPYN